MAIDWTRRGPTLNLLLFGGILLGGVFGFRITAEAEIIMKVYLFFLNQKSKIGIFSLKNF